MASFTLDDIRAAAEAKYGATEIELEEGKTVRLINALRLPKKRRDELMGLQDDNEGAVPDEELEKVVRLVAETQAQAEWLLGAVGDDLAVLATIIEEYSKGTQAGEASPSHD